jgi:hypothetical protein
MIFDPVCQTLQPALLLSESGLTLGLVIKLVLAKTRRKCVVKQGEGPQTFSNRHLAEQTCFFGFEVGPAGAERAKVLHTVIIHDSNWLHCKKALAAVPGGVSPFGFAPRTAL